MACDRAADGLDDQVERAVELAGEVVPHGGRARGANATSEGLRAYSGGDASSLASTTEKAATAATTTTRGGWRRNRNC